MNIMAAAHTLRRNSKGLSMGDALAWAWQCRREAHERAERELAARQAEFYTARRERVKVKRFLDDLRNQPLARSKTTREGGWCIEHQPKTVREIA